MTIRTLVPVALLGLALAGCGSAPTYSDLKTTEPAVAAGLGRIYFYRPGEVGGAAMQPSVTVNGAVVGGAVPAGYFYVDEPAGTYAISTSSNANEVVRAIVRAGDVRYVRLEVSLEGPVGGHVIARLVWPDQGASEITKCHFIGNK